MNSQKPTIADLEKGRDNNFNLIRFLAATAVVASHSAAIVIGDGAYSPLRAWIGMDIGNIAVDAFFVTSGFLVTGSLLKRTAQSFAIARIQRVMPAYVVSLVFCTLIVGPAFTDLSLTEYIASPQTWRFFLKNLLLLGGSEFRLPGVFASSPISEVVNGSLWTLPWEARLYCVLGLLSTSVALIRFLGCRNVLADKSPNDVNGVCWQSHRWLCSILIAISVGLTALRCVNVSLPTLSTDGLRVCSMFFNGAAMFALRQFLPMSWKTLLAIVCVILVATIHFRVFQIVYAISFPYVVLGLALVPAGAIRKFNKFGDYSYGVYIFSFPIQQAIFAILGTISLPAMFLLSMFFSLSFAIPSWHCIEKSFLSKHTS